MKFLITLSVLFLSAQSYACSTYEAQLRANVASIEVVDSGECKVMLKNISNYTESKMCPLSRSEVKDKGIYVDAYRCKSLRVESIIHSIVVQLSEDEIVLD
jgi:hypothetical protein